MHGHWVEKLIFQLHKLFNIFLSFQFLLDFFRIKKLAVRERYHVVKYGTAVDALHSLLFPSVLKWPPLHENGLSRVSHEGRYNTR